MLANHSPRPSLAAVLGNILPPSGFGDDG
jgi:hypothetical protein